MIGSPAVYAIELKTPLTDVGASGGDDSANWGATDHLVLSVVV